MAAAAAYYEKAAIVDFPCVVEGMRHMFSLIPLGSDIFDTEFLRCLSLMGGRAYFGGGINSAPTGRGCGRLDSMALKECSYGVYIIPISTIIGC